MSVQNPTTLELSANIIAQLETELNQTIPLLPKAFNRVLSKAIAGVYILLYKYIGFGILQSFVKSASFEETIVNGQVFIPLLEWGRLIGVGDPVPATQAELTITVTVQNQTGTLPAGSQLVYSPTGITYLTLTTVPLDAPTKEVVMRASADQSGGNGSGVIGNLENGTLVSFANPLSNVARDTVVANTVVTGANGESAEAYRQRVIDRFQKRPQGGASADYESWSEEVAGIINAYPYTSDCPGQVEVYVEATEASSGSADGIPTQAQLDAVKNSIEFDQNGLASRRPVDALVNVFSINQAQNPGTILVNLERTPFQLEVFNLTGGDTGTVTTQIADAFDEYMREREPFILGLSVPPRLDEVSVNAVGGIVSQVAAAGGSTFTNIAVRQNVGGAEISVPYALGKGEKAKSVGTIFTPPP